MSLLPSGMSHRVLVSSSFPSTRLALIRQEKCLEMKGAVCNFQQLGTFLLRSQDGWIPIDLEMWSSFHIFT